MKKINIITILYKLEERDQTHNLYTPDSVSTTLGHGRLIKTIKYYAESTIELK